MGEYCLTNQNMRGIQYEDQVIYTTGITVKEQTSSNTKLAPSANGNAVA